MTSAIAFNLHQQRSFLHSVDKFVLLTAAALEIVAANGAPRDKLVLNRLGVDRASGLAPADRVPKHAPPIRVGYVGRYDRIKGVVDFAKAIAALPRDVAVAFDLRGPADTADSRQVRAEVERLAGSDPRVTFGPPLTPATVPVHLESLDLLCCPSVCLEGGPTVALEAHAVGTPVIGTRIGGLAEIVEDGRSGRLVPPGDWRALGRVLEEVARDPSPIARWRAALPPVRTMDEVADEYLELYAA
jgi:glycosyltransferase involved in cell wall biosynthesis